jgi:hypothetical protein
MAHGYGGSSWGDGGDGATHALARGLGWFSIGLGVTELVAPGQLARFLGMEERTELIRAYGAREIMTGIGILSQEDPTPWLWGRVAGDAVDLATLAPGLRADNPCQRNVIVAVAAMVDAVCAQQVSRQRRTRAANRRRLRARDYSNRRGMLGPPCAALPETWRYRRICEFRRPCAPTPQEVRLSQWALMGDGWCLGKSALGRWD